MPVLRLAFVRSLLTIAALCLAPLGASAQTQRPLLVEGMSSVYQRVLTRPGAILHSAPNATAIDQLPTFQPLYVYARQSGWSQVGPSVSSGATGWVPDAGLVPWKQNIVTAFTSAANRNRQLIFDTEDNLRWLLNHEALSAMQERLLAEADTGIINGSNGVVSVEPAEFVSIRDEFYLMPILDFVEDLHPASYDDVLLMQVASIPLNAPEPEEQHDGSTGEFDVGIVFVFDTTQSMDPYIALTQRVIQNTVQQIGGTSIGDLVNFGVVGFRDNANAVPGLEYRTKVLVPLERRENQSEVIAGIAAATNVARVSSPGFNEDSAAGVEDALDQIDWDQLQGDGDPFDARYIILVTDAGPKDPRDANARSPIGMAELQAEAEDRRIALMTLHLKTPQGSASHEYAAAKYRDLSRFDGKTFYYPIENGAEEAFAGTAQRLVVALTDHVRAAQGQASLQPESDQDEDLVELGRAMRLAYLGAQQGTQVPDVLTGWVTDKAMEAPSRLALEPRLLLSKNEMSTMAQLLDNLITLAEQSQTEGDSFAFFDQVRGVIADMATNPDVLVNADTDTLGGALEYLEQLPYRSLLLTITEDRWAEGAMLRRTVIDGMRQKLTQYRKWLFDPTAWTALYEGAPDGEHVFAMPFDVLP